MDIHFNIFQAYHGGNLNSPDEINRLEDNFTRAFLITLQKIKENCSDEFKKIVNTLIGQKVNDSCAFDLQNLNDKNTLRKLQKSNNKIFLSIARNKHDIDVESIKKEYSKVGKILDNLNDENKKKALKNEIKQAQKKNQDLEFEGFNIKADELSFFYSLLHECRPDGWIYEGIESNNPMAVLIESKVGNNKLTNAQIIRHLLNENGFNIKDIPNKVNDQMFICKTWDDIYRCLSNYENEFLQNEKGVICIEIIKEFKEYLEMSGEVLSLKLANENSNDQDILRKQLRLFLEKLDIEVEKEFSGDLKRGDRNLDGNWDFYGKLNGTEISQNPHFSIYMFEEELGCVLTSSKGKTKRVLEHKSFKQTLNSFYSQNKENLGSDFLFFELMNYRIIDWKKGQIRGDSADTFRLKIRFDELEKSSLSIDGMIDTAIKFRPLAKQVDIGIKFPWVKLKDENTEKFRARAYNLISNPDELIRTYIEFMKCFKHLL
ncbi:MAG: hypothetical protein ISR69_06355 [Gammaproteobacteria bacterium]|nr:hypothetical protein [Gammaproteobacteria bacterium]